MQTVAMWATFNPCRVVPIKASSPKPTPSQFFWGLLTVLFQMFVLLLTLLYSIRQLWFWTQKIPSWHSGPPAFICMNSFFWSSYFRSSTPDVAHNIIWATMYFLMFDLSVKMQHWNSQSRIWSHVQLWPILENGSFLANILNCENAQHWGNNPWKYIYKKVFSWMNKSTITRDSCVFLFLCHSKTLWKHY